MNNAYPTAGVRITVKDFVPTSKVPRHPSADEIKIYFSTASVDLISDADGYVTQAHSDAPLKVVPHTKVDFVFEVVNGKDDGAIYLPVGVSFYGEHGDVGIADFPTRCVTGDAFKRLLLRVHDANVHSTNFKFSVIIQCQESGQLGVIDPQVANG